MVRKITVSPENDIRIPPSLAVASYRLNEVEKKIMLALSGSFNKKGLCSIHVSDLAKVCGFPPSQAKRYVTEQTSNIMRRVITFKMPDGSKYLTHWVQSFGVSPDGLLTFKVDELLVPRFQELHKAYVALECEKVMSLTGTHTIRIYELIKQYHHSKRREFKLEELIEMFQLGKSYKSIGDIKRRVINPAIKEINEKTNVVLEAKYYKAGRKVVSVEFSWTTKGAERKAKQRAAAKKKTSAAETKKPVRLTKADREPPEYKEYVWEKDNILPDKEKLRLKKMAEKECQYCKGRGWGAKFLKEYGTWIQTECICTRQTHFDYDKGGTK